MCRKRKPRKNTTKGWFPKETPNENVASSSVPAEDVAASSSPPSSPPRIQKKSCSQVDPQEEECNVLVSDVVVLVSNYCVVLVTDYALLGFQAQC
jgi:hypothetical protein